MFKTVATLCVVSLILVGCGGTSGTSTNVGGSQSTPGQAQGVYSGTTSTGYSFESIVLPNDKFYGIYGTVSGNVLLLYGMVTGQGASSSGTYTASVTDFLYTGAIYTDSLTENGTQITFSGTVLPASSFNYSTPASLSAISGTWTGTLLDGAPTTVTISASGSVSGASQGCSFSGTVAPDSSNKNFFDVSLTFGGNPCALPNQTASGIGVEYLLSDGVTQQLLAGVTVGTSEGTVFVATR